MINTESIVIELDNNDIAVMQFITMGRGNVLPVGARFISDKLWIREPSDDNIQYEVNKTFDGREVKPIKWTKIKFSDIPQDRTFRKSWEFDGYNIKENLEKSREVFKNRLRSARKIKLEQLDIRYLRAIESGDEVNKALIAKDKERLRDLPNSSEINSATLEKLKQLNIDKLLDG